MELVALGVEVRSRNAVVALSAALHTTSLHKGWEFQGIVLHGGIRQGLLLIGRLCEDICSVLRFALRGTSCLQRTCDEFPHPMRLLRECGVLHLGRRLSTS